MKISKLLDIYVKHDEFSWSHPVNYLLILILAPGVMQVLSIVEIQSYVLNAQLSTLAFI